MRTLVVSDIHIGSPFFYSRRFERFLDALPEGDELVLNGDLIDNPYARMEANDLRMIDRIRQEAGRRRVVWVRGNHDNSFQIGEPGEIESVQVYGLGKQLLVAHGDGFDEIMPRNLAFIRFFRLLHDMRVRLGARPVHVAYYAKKWSRFYRVLRDNVMKNAVQCALENGYGAVACGHTHYPEDRVYRGVRYINTGSWTEPSLFYLEVDARGMELRREAEVGRERWTPAREERPEAPFSLAS